MPPLSQNPSWTTLPNSIIEPFFHLIKRWAKTSKSKDSYTEQTIKGLIIKLFYIIVTESQLKLEYSSLLNRDFLRKYHIKSSSIPKNISKISQMFEIQTQGTYSRDIVDFYFILIHRTFKSIAERYHISLKSELRIPKPITFSKVYELQLLVDLCYTHFSQNDPFLLKFGGVPALLSESLSKYFDTISKSRNKTGSIFTPLWIIQLITERIKENYDLTINSSNIEIADLSVGFGGFLEFILSTIKFQNEKLHGFDVDAFKIDILKLNHAILRQQGQLSIQLKNFRLKNSLLYPPTQKFDILVGNPPWGAKIDKSKISQVEDLSEFTVKQYDSYGLFLIRNILSLKEEGMLFLVLPETFLLNPNYEKLRKYLVENTTILEIIHLGENVFEGVNMPALVIGLQKVQANINHQLKIYQNVDEQTNLDQVSPLLRLQIDFTKNQGAVFDIFTSSNERSLIEQIDKLDCYQLHELVNNSRGVEIGKKGEVIQCYHCDVWMPVPVWSLDHQTGGKFASCSVCKQKIYLDQLRKRENIIINDEPDEEPSARFLLGENIKKFVISGNKFIILNRRGIKYKPATLYQQNKILVRKTSKKILATIDYDNSYTIQVVYQFSLKESFRQNPFLLEFILGILSSRIIQFYYAKKFQYSHRKSFPHHIQKNILSLPIPRIDFSDIEVKFEKHYWLIVINTMTMMFIAHFNEFHSAHETLKQKLMNITKENNLFPLFKQIENTIHQSYHSLIENPSIIEDRDKLISLLQNELDSEVDQLFRALM